MSPNMSDTFRLDEKITLLPVVHRSGANAKAVESWLLERKVDCLAVPLPASFRESVLAGVEQLPTLSIVVQAPEPEVLWGNEETEWSPEREDGPDSNDDVESELENGVFPYSYVPIDPSQSVIAAIRYAMGERIPIRFIDLETEVYEGEESYRTPDCYALRDVPLDTFNAALLTTIKRPESAQIAQRIDVMASRLHRLRQYYQNIVMVCSVQHWPWIREAYQRQLLESQPREEEAYEAEPAINYSVEESTLAFMLGELPYLTAVYEQARYDLVATDAHAPAIDGVKRLLLSARASYMADFGKRARKISPSLISQCLKYIRNLSLLDRRFTPDMYTLVLAAKQTCGDQFAIHVTETLRNYAFQEYLPWPTVKMGIQKLQLPEGEIVPALCRLGEEQGEWRSLNLNRRPLKDQSRKWQMQWNPFKQCSWLPEDAKIESFRTRVIERAKAIIGADLARSEKFTTSLMDGIDIRETLRHWYAGDLYVKVEPPSVGTLDACLFLFDPQPDPATYSWRTTWFAELEWESTLAFYATDFRKEILGPGIAVANYGGALFLYPPRPIRDVWEDRELEFADTLEERLVAAACMHSESKQIALLSPVSPTAIWRRIAKRFGKSLVHVPMSQFSDAMVAQLRTVHVLNGKEVRSYAAHFIRQV